MDAGASAKTLDRPGLNQALGMMKAGKADALLVVKLDRLTRSVRDLGTLVEDWFSGGRWALLSVSENIDTRSAAGRLVLNVLASVAQWEREAIGERTSAALAYKRTQGQFTGGRAPYGHRVATDGDTLEPDPAEQAIIAAAREARAAGLTLRAVGQELARRGLVNRLGKVFGQAELCKMVRAARWRVASRPWMRSAAAAPFAPAWTASPPSTPNWWPRVAALPPTPTPGPRPWREP